MSDTMAYNYIVFQRLGHLTNQNITVTWEKRFIFAEIVWKFLKNWYHIPGIAISVPHFCSKSCLRLQCNDNSLKRGEKSFLQTLISNAVLYISSKMKVLPKVFQATERV